MSIKLVPPKPGRTPNYHLRGSHLGVAVNRSAKSAVKRIAQQEKKRIEDLIEAGKYNPDPVDESAPDTFLADAVAYMKAGGDAAFLSPIIEHAGSYSIRDKRRDQITQADLDNLAAELYPNATPQTRNRQVYTPIAAVLHRAGDQRKFKRPKGWRGKKSFSKLEPDQAFALLDAADQVDREFGLLCCLLNYTGRRITETLDPPLADLDLKRAVLLLRDTKNGEPVEAHLPPIVVQKFKDMPPRPFRDGSKGRSQEDAGVPFLKRSPDRRIFRFHYGSYLRGLLAEAMKIAGLKFPRRQCGFHLFCHTWGTWMHRYNRLDNYGLARTNRWKDPRSAEIYIHTEPGDEARLADNLPTPIRAKDVQTKKKAKSKVKTMAHSPFTRERS
jgi:integrase